ncbi:MAG TPA: hypothetical protein PLJ27_03525 [Polyangiaceae bacterium]|nr:hypothetical protein [Polyangiaceae bacterium]
MATLVGRHGLDVAQRSWEALRADLRDQRMKRFDRHGGWCAGLVLLVSGIAVSSLAIAQGQHAAAGSGSASARPNVGYAPDPPPIRSASQWLLTLQYQRGKVRLLDARRVVLARPAVTARRMGRYAVELLSGPTVIERVRFEFPLIGADELAGKPRPMQAPPSFESKATVTYRVMLPDTPRASRARFVDRATGESFMIPWPPIRPASVPGRHQDAGKDHIGDEKADAHEADGGTTDGDKRRDGGGPDGARDANFHRDIGSLDVIPLDS